MNDQVLHMLLLWELWARKENKKTECFEALEVEGEPGMSDS